MLQFKFTIIVVWFATFNLASFFFFFLQNSTRGGSHIVLYAILQLVYLRRRYLRWLRSIKRRWQTSGDLCRCENTQNRKSLLLLTLLSSLLVAFRLFAHLTLPFSLSGSTKILIALQRGAPDAAQSKRGRIVNNRWFSSASETGKGLAQFGNEFIMSVSIKQCNMHYKILSSTVVLHWELELKPDLDKNVRNIWPKKKEELELRIETSCKTASLQSLLHPNHYYK